MEMYDTRAKYGILAFFMPELSVIIPTHKRSQILATCLQHLEKQSAASKLEVIVVSDGPDAATAELVTSTAWQVPVRYYEIPKSQQGTARNYGVQQALAPTCLFIGDDIFLQEDACARHILAQTSAKNGAYFYTAMLGYVTWDPTLDITPVMTWLEQSGWQFGYPKINRYAHGFIPRSKQHLFTYTSHISVPTTVAREYPFREDISLYGWEDVEWGQRLRLAGVSLYYEPMAVGLHHHHMTLPQSLSRMETLGESVVILQRKVPRLHRRPRGLKRLAYTFAALIPSLSGKHRRAYLRGIRRANRHHEIT